MPLFTPPDQTIETTSAVFMANGALTPQTLLLSVIETRYALTISTIECFFAAVNAANPTIELGMYTWSPTGTLLGSATVVPTGPGFWTVSLATPISLAPRTRYYMAYLNRTASDVTTSLGVVGTNTYSTLISAAMASQTVMPANLASLTTTNANRLVLRAWS
jgi:hypothetical protein